MAKKEIFAKQKTTSAKNKAKKILTKENIIIIVVVLVLALIDVALIVGVILYDNDHDNDDAGTKNEEANKIEYPTYSTDSTVETEGKYYDASKTGSGVDVDMEKVKEEIGAYDYDDFVASKIETDFVVIRVEDYGDIVVALRDDIAPVTVNNIKALTLKNFYDDTTIHRVIKDFMIQGGGKSESNGDEKADSIFGEFTNNGHTNNLLHVNGVISMARTSDNNNSATSQFFIMHGDSSHLDGDYASFGYVLAGLDVVDAIAKCDVEASAITGEKSVPVTQIVIKDVFFVEPKADTGLATNKKVTGNADRYEITVVDENETPIQGVSLKLIGDTTSKDVYVVTNKYGKAEFDIQAAGCYIEILSAEGYLYEDRYELTKETESLIVKLTKETEADESDGYEITVVDENDAPIQCVSLKLINASTGKIEGYAVTNLQGKAKIDTNVAGGYIEIVSAEGYLYEDRYELPAGEESLTIKLSEETETDEAQ